MKKRILALVCITIILLSAFTACAAQTSSTNAAQQDLAASGQNNSESYAPAEASSGSGTSSKPQNAESSILSGRQIVYTAQAALTCKDAAGAAEKIRAAAETAGGYIQSSDRSERSGSVYSSLTVRIPADAYRAFMDGLSAYGDIESQTENTEDITSSYIDVQSRLAALKEQKSRLEEMRASAATVDDLLRIEQEISDVQYQIEDYTAQLKTYDNETAYCTVTLTLSQPGTVEANSGGNFASDALTALQNGLGAFGVFWQGLAVGVLAALPFLVAAGLIVWLVIFLRKKHKKTAQEKDLKS